MSTDNLEIVEVKKWKTKDGDEFYSLESAAYHAEQIALSEKATETLNSGGSVAEALRGVGKEKSIHPVFEKITKDTKLVISYWQCRDQPGYKVIRFNSNWTVFVYGNAGSWSGSYGNDVKLLDLARYAMDENTVF